MSQTTVNQYFRISNFSGTEVPDTLLTQFGKLRYKCFDPDDPHVNMNKENKIELDHFDRAAHLRYVFITRFDNDGTEQLACGMRIIPTLYDYELEMSSYRYLTREHILPKSPTTVEAGRWVGLKYNTPAGQVLVGLLNRELYQWAKRQGIDSYVGVITTHHEAFFLEQGISIDRLTTPYQLDNGQSIVAIQTQLDSLYEALSIRQFQAGMQAGTAINAA